MADRDVVRDTFDAFREGLRDDQTLRHLESNDQLLDEVPHLNLEVQIHGEPQPWLDPHTPIDPSTIRTGDYP